MLQINQFSTVPVPHHNQINYLFSLSIFETKSNKLQYMAASPFRYQLLSHY